MRISLFQLILWDKLYRHEEGARRKEGKKEKRERGREGGKEAVKI